MFGFLYRKALWWFADRQKGEKGQEQPKEARSLGRRLEDNLNAVRAEMGGSNDLVVREFLLAAQPPIKAALVFVDGLVSSKTVNDDVMKPLLYDAGREEPQRVTSLEQVKNTMLAVGDVKECATLDEAVGGFLAGDTVLLAEGMDKGLIISTKGFEKRGVDEPASEAVVRGPRESFVENIRTNTSLLRRKIRNPELTFEAMVLGKRTRTTVLLAYVRGLARPALLDNLRARLRAIDTDAILESGYVEQYIEDSAGSIFATLGYTEKPDVAAAKLLEGRVAVLVDGTPFVLTAPVLFIEHFQSAEDYYFRPYFATLLRVVRALGFAITILAPAFYVAVTTFHQELIPTLLLFTMAKAREGVPFPSFVECLIMILTFEILREAGIRLPRPVGQALSIVGALVIGESAVSAGLIGAPMVIVVAITAVSGFTVPNLADSGAVLRLILLVLGAAFGGYGITLGLLGTLVHMLGLESFDFPYLSPLAPFDLEDNKDTLVRAPLWLMVSRPKNMAGDRQRRRAVIPSDDAGGTDGGAGGGA